MVKRLHATQESLEKTVLSLATPAQKAKLASLPEWKIVKSVTHDTGTGIFIQHPDGRFALCPPTADARLIVAAKNTNTIHYCAVTWARR